MQVDKVVALLTKHEVLHKAIKDLSTQEYKDCYNLNFRHNGSMQPELSEQRTMITRNRHFPGEVFGIWEDARLISWALVFRKFYHIKPGAYFYTRVEYRQRGYGKAIANAIALVYPETRVYPHDPRSHTFFNKVHVYVG
jgi:hypothetical protein